MRSGGGAMSPFQHEGDKGEPRQHHRDGNRLVPGSRTAYFSFCAIGHYCSSDKTWAM